MLCKVADLLVEIPEAGGMAPRCKEYLANGAGADIVIREESYEPERWPGMPHALMCYMESGELFFLELIRYNGIVLHASAVEMEGKAYLFSGPCTVGKSTHTRLWQQVFGEVAQVFNDDKPALRLVDGRWYAYGTPWCGKDGINQNKKVPLAGICFLKQGPQEHIRLLDPEAAIPLILWQAMRFISKDKMGLLLSLLDDLVKNIPVYELENRPVEAAARLSYETMSRGMQ